MNRRRSNYLKNQTGAVLIKFVLFLPILIGMVAMAFDVVRLAVAKNELQNAADAGALAAARFLYNDSGTSVNTGANQIGYDAATANKSQNLPVEVDWSGGNSGDVERGHWSFGMGALPRGFTPNGSTAPVSLWNVSTETLDANPNFINAVRVTARRESTPILSYFARIFNIDSWGMNTSAIAYIGYAGRLLPGDVDQPIAICEDSLLIGGNYSCSIGRMINSGKDTQTNETGGWTSFNQDDACTGGTNAQEVRGLVSCNNDGNPDGLQLGVPMATNGGDIQSAFSKLRDCWTNQTGQSEIWNLTLPVVTCPSNNVGTCEALVGAVNLNVVWITGAGEDPGFNAAPYQMGGWSSSDTDGQVRWNSFVNHFNLQNADGTSAPYAKKSIYFLPDCSPHELAGGTGGRNFGILAKIPVLVD
jgi:hypothetical protein